MNFSEPVAVLADIHGNAYALEAVFAHAQAQGIDQFVNLGDSFYGPLDPGSTWQMLEHRDIPTILGNQDRLLLESGVEWQNVPAFRASVSALGKKGMSWLRTLPATRLLDGDVLLCHGTPGNDCLYLLEEVSSGHPVMRECRDILKDILPLAGDCSLVLAGHSHFPGSLICGGRTLLNPGSVGLPAYQDAIPPHAMESGSPHARYAVVLQVDFGWDISFHAVEYDWLAASELARQNGRDDWARWLLTGVP